MKVLMDDLLILDGRLIYRWTLEGTNTGTGGTGNQVRLSGSEEWQIGSDGLIAESHVISTAPNTSVNWNKESGNLASGYFIPRSVRAKAKSPVGVMRRLKSEDRRSRSDARGLTPEVRKPDSRCRATAR